MVLGHMGYFREEVDVNKRVLLAEDEADLRKMMKILLELHGYEVIEAADGYEAVEKAVEQEPDLILMDIAMPVMDGIDSARTIRRHEGLRRIPIVAVTAYGDFYSQRARNAGCTDVVQKPIDFAQLKPMVERYLN
jgi:two-component system cell cycle response regulator DivK